MSYPPLEQRFLDLPLDKGGPIKSKKVPALSPAFSQADSFRWVGEFFFPPYPFTAEEFGHWEEVMEVLEDDLKWLLSLEHHTFWSTVVYSPQLVTGLLASFHRRAPRFYDPSYENWQEVPDVWRRYKGLYVLFFRVYMRLLTYKESKEDHISPAAWVKLLRENGIVNLIVLQDLAAIYGSKDNPLFGKMVENFIKHDKDGYLLQELRELPLYLTEKLTSLTAKTETITKKKDWIENRTAELDDILWFKLDMIFSLLKLLKTYPPGARVFLEHPRFLSRLSAGYDNATRLWGQIMARCPSFEKYISLCRVAVLRLYRFILVTPTISEIESSNDKKLDEFFQYLSESIDDMLFIHDYEKQYPFKADMQSLLSRGIFVDETRIDYMANAISACFHSCGEEYAVEKIVVDPLYDPNFDRQLLGACSLEISGPELDSLITQVQDILPELPKSYVEAVLKHYDYKPETTIHALLEGSVPKRLEKYKNPEYIKSQATTVHPPEQDESSENLPVSLSCEKLEMKETYVPGKGKRVEAVGKLDSETKSKILHIVQEPSDKRKGREEIENAKNSYVELSLLPPAPEFPPFDYDDEYDDTYDDVIDVVEPDNILRLNIRKSDTVGYREDNDEEEAEEPDGKPDLAWCEDPAIVRGRYEQRRLDKNRHRGGGHGPGPGPTPQPRDVVGRARGQGQDKSVVYNRRQKTENKGAGGNFKKRADFKRKEF